MRAKKFVSRTDQEIASQLLHVDRPVRRKLHGINIHQRAGLVRQRGHFFHRVDRAGGIAGIPKGSQLRAFVQRSLKIRQVQRAIRRVNIHPAHAAAAFLRQLHPRRNVSVMIQPGHHQRITRVEDSPQGSAHLIGQRGHVRAEDNLLRPPRVEEIGRRLACLVNQRIRLTAGPKCTAVIGVRFHQVAAHAFQAAPRHLRSARIVEVNAIPLQRGKLSTNGWTVQRHGHLRW